MKKVLLTLFAATVVFAASAQISKGTILLAGNSNLNFQSNNEDAGDDSDLTLNLKGGYFFMDNLAGGLVVQYAKNSEADDAATAFGPFVRYYVNGKIILGAAYLLGSAGDFKANALQIEAGYAIFANDAVAIEPSVYYQMYSGDAEGASFGLNVGISVYLGRGE
jgi:hypothetical protein